MNQSVGNDLPAPQSRNRYRKGQATRKLILDAAVRQFAAAGYGGSSVADLANQAGSSKNQLFHHFGSKEDLAIGATDAALAMWMEQVAAVTAAYIDPLRRLDEVVLASRRLEQNSWPAGRLLLLLTLTADSLPPRLRGHSMASMAGVTSFITGLCRQACRNHPDLSVSSEDLAGLVLGMLFYIPLHQSNSNSALPSVVLGMDRRNSR